MTYEKFRKQQTKRELPFIFMIIVLSVTALFFSGSAKAQVSAKTTPLSITQDEAKAISKNLYNAEIILHKLDIPALKRDSLDLYIGQVSQFMYDKSQVAIKSDTAKVVKPIKK